MNTFPGPGLVMTMQDQHAVPPRLTGGEILVFKKCTQLHYTPPCIKRVHGLLAEETQAQDLWNFGLLKISPDHFQKTWSMSKAMLHIRFQIEAEK